MLVKPIVTEKSLKLSQSHQFTFEVLASASKAAVKKAIQDQFQVTVLAVKTAKTAAKPKHTLKLRRRIYTSPQKKALVTLKPGDTIDYFQLPEESRPKGRGASAKPGKAKKK